MAMATARRKKQKCKGDCGRKTSSESGVCRACSAPCDNCGKDFGVVYWSNLTKQFCSLDCTNQYLEAEGFDPISGPGESSQVREEFQDPPSSEIPHHVVNKGGRPKGSKTTRVVVEIYAAYCPKCGSSDRTAYTHSRSKQISGALLDGRPYSNVIWQRCKCLKCGQTRVEKTFER